MRNNILSFIVIGIFFIVGFVLISQSPRNLASENIKEVKIVGQSIKVELALTSDDQERGLSGRHSLDDDKGMLFVFPKSGVYSFWMKDMNFPIDIIWIGENMKVVYIKENAQPESYPTTYGLDTNTKYVLEVVSGFSQKNNLKVGDRVEFTY